MKHFEIALIANYKFNAIKIYKGVSNTKLNFNFGIITDMKIQNDVKGNSRYTCVRKWVSGQSFVCLRLKITSS